MKKFTDTPEISRLLDEIREKGLDSKIYSDIVDEQGNQYVDLVQEGGGVLGIALTGYTWILEKCGIRFFSLAGTSAGAINTMMIASMGRIGEPVSEKIAAILADKDLSDFIDGDTKIRSLVNRYIKDKKYLKLFVVLNSSRIWRILKRFLGVNPGNEFEEWLSGCLREAGVEKVSELSRLRADVPLLFDRTENNAPVLRIAGLKIITSDITTKSKIVFPEMAELYWKDPDSVNPARFVRASMSIPFFFYPFTVDNIPDAGKKEDEGIEKSETRWRRHAGYYGKIPGKVMFVDGGMLSNFPINAFHLNNGIPKKPTFGAKLSSWRAGYTSVDTLGKMVGAMISTMRQLHDYDFLRQNTDYNSLICHIEADAGFNWLDFEMKQEEQVALFQLGAEKAVKFLENFDWEGYKRLRREKSSS